MLAQTDLISTSLNFCLPNEIYTITFKNLTIMLKFIGILADNHSIFMKQPPPTWNKQKWNQYTILFLFCFLFVFVFFCKRVWIAISSVIYFQYLGSCFLWLVCLLCLLLSIHLWLRIISQQIQCYKHRNLTQSDIYKNNTII